jgi:hypothetical protein
MSAIAHNRAVRLVLERQRYQLEALVRFEDLIDLLSHARRDGVKLRFAEAQRTELDRLCRCAHTEGRKER